MEFGILSLCSKVRVCILKLSKRIQKSTSMAGYH